MADAFHPRRIRALWLCGILHAFTHLYTTALFPLYLILQRDLRLAGEAQATFLVTALGFAYCLASLPMGVLADRVDRRFLLGAGLAANGLAFIGLSQAPSYGWAIAFAMAAGLAGSFFHPAATSMVADLFPDQRGKALGRVAIGAAFGFWFGPAYSGWRATSAGWRAPVLELGLMGLAMAVAFFLLAPPAPAQPHPSEAHPHRHPSLSRAGFWALIVLAGWLFSFRDFAAAGVATTLSLFLQHARGFDAAATGVLLGGMCLVSLVSNPLFGAMSDRVRLRLAAALIGLAAVAIAFVPWVSRAWLVPLLLFHMFFFMANFPVVEAALMEAVPAKTRGRVFGLFFTICGTIGNSAHWVSGGLVQRLPDQTSQAYTPLFFGWAVLMLLSISGLTVLNAIRHRPRLAEDA
ncbi:MAG: MFS transporter [Verrucomicrobiae bacterium]|nr:MFS transporter [Verrucomicrobiae bacterium]